MKLSPAESCTMTAKLIIRIIMINAEITLSYLLWSLVRKTVLLSCHVNKTLHSQPRCAAFLHVQIIQIKWVLHILLNSAALRITIKTWIFTFLLCAGNLSLSASVQQLWNPSPFSMQNVVRVQNILFVHYLEAFVTHHHVYWTHTLYC